MVIIIYLLMEKKPLSLKLTIKMLTFRLNFVQESCLMDRATKSRKISLKGNVHDFLVDYNAIKKY